MDTPGCSGPFSRQPRASARHLHRPSGQTRSVSSSGPAPALAAEPPPPPR